MPADGDAAPHSTRPDGGEPPTRGAYFDEAGDGTYDAYGLMVLARRDGRIAGITGFAEIGEVLPRLGLPERLG